MMFKVGERVLIDFRTTLDIADPQIYKGIAEITEVLPDENKYKTNTVEIIYQLGTSAVRLNHEAMWSSKYVMALSEPVDILKEML